VCARTHTAARARERAPFDRSLHPHSQPNLLHPSFAHHTNQDDDNLADALRYAAALLGELRTSLLAPPTYFELYLKATEHLGALASWFAGEPDRGRSLASLYARVQGAGNVLPRLYLMAAAGRVCAAGGALPARDVLADLAEMARGVQHPVRGLFLRAYLCQIARAVLPGCDGGGEARATPSSDGAPASSSAAAAAGFLLSNFAEANKLWVRMAHQAGGGAGGGGAAAAPPPSLEGHPPPPATASAATRSRRDRERTQLAELVGKNLHLLARLEGLDLALYAASVLPAILAQVLGCRDPLAQTYLAQCVVQAFPDEFHAATLPALLAAFGGLAPGAGLAVVFGGLGDRLAAAALASTSTSDSPTPGAADPAVAALRTRSTFDALADAASGAVAKQPDLSAAEVAALFGGLARFASAVHAAPGAAAAPGGGPAAPASLDTVDAALAACVAALAARGGLTATDAAGVRAVVGLLSEPLDAAAAAGGDVTALLALPSFPALAAVLPPPARREIASKVATAVVARAEPVADPAAAAVVLSFIRPLLVSDEIGVDGAASAATAADVEEECALVARLIHRLAAPGNPGAHFTMLVAARAAVGAGGPARLAALLPPLAFGGLAVARAASAAGAVGDDRRASGDGVEDILSSGPAKSKAASGVAAQAAGQQGGAAAGVTAADALRFVGECAGTLSEEGASPQAALALLLAAALGASAAGLELVAYDCFERAFLLYEDGIPGSAGQRSALGAVTGALVAACRLGPDSRAALAGKVASYASTLLRKADQCRALCACAYLHWQPEDGSRGGGGAGGASPPPPPPDGEAAVACLRRALKAAAASGAQAAAAAASSSPAANPSTGPSTPAALYTEVLGHLLRLAGDACPAVSGEMVQNLVDLIGTELGRGGEGKAADAASAAFFEATVAQGRAAVGGVLAGVRWGANE